MLNSNSQAEESKQDPPIENANFGVASESNKRARRPPRKVKKKKIAIRPMPEEQQLGVRTRVLAEEFTEIVRAQPER